MLCMYYYLSESHPKQAPFLHVLLSHGGKDTAINPTDAVTSVLLSVQF